MAASSRPVAFGARVPAAALLVLLAILSGCGGNGEPSADRHPDRVESVDRSADRGADEGEFDDGGEEASGDGASACVLDDEQVRGALASFGVVSVVGSDDGEREIGAGTCAYVLNEDAFDGQGAELDIERHRYVDDEVFTYSAEGFEEDWGGSTPQEVFDSAFRAYQGGGLAGGHVDIAQAHPEIADGMVDTGNAGFVLAATGDYWYEGAIFNIIGGPEHGPAMVKLAQGILANGG